MTASVATGTFPIHIHNNSKAHSRWPSNAACLTSGHGRQLCCALLRVNVRTQIQTLADTVVTVVTDDGGGAYVSADDIPEPAEIHLQHSRASTSVCGRGVQLSLGPRKRYLERSFLAGSIPLRRRVCDSEEQRSLSRLSWFPWHSREEPCSEGANQKAALSPPQAAFHVEVYRARPYTPGLLFPMLSPRMADDWSLATDGPSWRQSPALCQSCAALSRQMITLRMRTAIPSAPE